MAVIHHCNFLSLLDLSARHLGEITRIMLYRNLDSHPEGSIRCPLFLPASSSCIRTAARHC